MDPMVENDSKSFRWQLSKSETGGLLEALYPPSFLFGSTLGMEDVLNDLREGQFYGMTSGVEGELESWTSFPSLSGKDAEERAAVFLNNILERVEAFTGKKTKRSIDIYLIVSIRLTHHSGDGTHSGPQNPLRGHICYASQILSSAPTTPTRMIGGTSWSLER